MGGPKFKSRQEAAYQGFPQFHQTRLGIITDISSQLLPSILFIIHYTLSLYVIYQGTGIV